MDRASSKGHAGRNTLGVEGVEVDHPRLSSRAIDDNRGDVLEVGAAAYLGLGPKVGDEQTGDLHAGFGVNRGQRNGQKFY